jgi:hypothetical protein
VREEVRLAEEMGIPMQFISAEEIALTMRSAGGAATES